MRNRCNKDLRGVANVGRYVSDSEWLVESLRIRGNKCDSTGCQRDNYIERSRRLDPARHPGAEVFAEP